HNCVIGKNVIIAAQTGISGSSVVEDGAILGGQVGIGEHATVGAGVILGGGAGVLSGKKMQGAGQVFWGRPARPLKEYLRDLARLRKGLFGNSLFGGSSSSSPSRLLTRTRVAVCSGVSRDRRFRRTDSAWIGRAASSFC